MIRALRFAPLGVAAALAVTAFAVTPAYAATACSSNYSLLRSSFRVTAVLRQLNEDQHDYGGHRVAAINALNTASAELAAAEKYAVDVEHQDPSCFETRPGAGSRPAGRGYSGVRSQAASNRAIEFAQRRVGGIIRGLVQDNDDYGGHKANALAALKSAQSELLAASSTP